MKPNKYTALHSFDVARFDAYQEASRSTVNFADRPMDLQMAYITLGLMGEAGEVSEKIKKLIRDKSDVTTEWVASLEKELGDVLWYMSRICDHFDISLGGVAAMNLHKLADRQARGVISGSGDNR